MAENKNFFAKFFDFIINLLTGRKQENRDVPPMRDVQNTPQAGGDSSSGSGSGSSDSGTAADTSTTTNGGHEAVLDDLDGGSTSGGGATSGHVEEVPITIDADDDLNARDLDPDPIVEESMDEASFKYGNLHLRVTKSKQFVAVKKDVGMAPAAPLPGMEGNRSMFPAGGSNAGEDAELLGDYELVRPVEETLESAEETLDGLRGSPLVEEGTHVYHSALHKNDTPLVPSGELYILFDTSATLENCLAVLEKYHLEVKERRTTHEYVVRVTKGSPNPIKTTVALQKLDIIEVAEPEFVTKPDFFFMPSDNLLKDQWHLENKGSHGNWPAGSFKAGADAKVVEAWRHLNNLGSSNVTVAVIDSGFDTQHPDLKGNGSKIVAPWDFEFDSPDVEPRSGDWHGTPCASVAVGAANGVGVVGACPNAKLMPIRFAYISDSQVERWFNHAMNNGADIISNSWGAPNPDFVMSTRMFNAIKKAATKGRNGKGCVIVFASGNSSRNITHPQHPTAPTGFATHPDIISVAASNSKDEFSSYSNFGDQISVCAPSNGNSGAGVTAADVGGTIPLPSGATGFKGYDAGDYTTSFGGTSSSCPLVAGVAGLILSANSSLTAFQVKRILETTTDKIGMASAYQNGHSRKFGHGRINALKAVKKAMGNDVPEDIPVSGGGGGNGSTTPPPPPPPPPPPIFPDLTPADSQLLPFEARHNGSFAREGQEIIFKIRVSDRLTVKLDSPIGDDNHDFDMYWKKGGVPTAGVHDISGATFGPDEQFNVNSFGFGKHYIMIRAYQGSGGFNLDVSMPKAPGESGVKVLPVSAMIGGILIKERREKVAYELSRSSRLTVKLTGFDDATNFDIYVKRGAIPKWNSNDGKGISGNSREEVILANPSPGDYYIMLRSQKGKGDYALSVALT